MPGVVVRLISSDDIDRHVDFPGLIDAMALAFAGEIEAPARHHHLLKQSGPIHLLMPAWTGNTPAMGAYLGTKIVSVFPNNAQLGLPSVSGVYVLQSGQTGVPLAIIDGTRLTHWRTAAASALAARFLARADAEHLLMVGAGALAPYLVRAHASVRPIRRVTLWNHRRDGADKLALALQDTAFEVCVTSDLPAAVAQADIISCATLAQNPLIRGEWLQPGVHLDLVGAFSMSMRECDDAALTSARVFIDTCAALVEGGDVAQALQSGALKHSDIVADLALLCRGEAVGRDGRNEITVFKSIGSAIEDLAAAILLWQRVSASS